VKERITSFVNEQPFFATALGLVAGAALAAVLSATKTEHEFMGPASDAVKGAVGEARSESVEAAKSAAGRIAPNAIGAAEREGLTPAAAADAVQNIGEKVKRAVSEAGASEINERTAGTSQSDIDAIKRTCRGAGQRGPSERPSGRLPASRVPYLGTPGIGDVLGGAAPVVPDGMIMSATRRSCGSIKRISLLSSLAYSRPFAAGT